MKSIMKNKKGQIATKTIQGIGGLVIVTVIILVITSTLLGANLLTTGSEEANVSNRLSANFTAGIDNVAAKLPTILLLVAVVILFGALVMLVRQSNMMGIGGSGSL